MFLSQVDKYDKLCVLHFGLVLWRDLEVTVFRLRTAELLAPNRLGKNQEED